ncbi:homeobox protein NOBOX-like [Cydia pomonella]|uniref:homeobox protein NOBOX-like n=1 Tax=Cydia pomonella TaxID=82600 RepID=UPI002ADE26A2|nr:homeobox protein NOBOX-like [Cydia pomonella]XP_061704598.1 homeobox protein NOBOX-like [Cydia pomonella]
MRYLCLNQAGPRVPHQAAAIAENTSKRKIEETMENYDMSEESVPMKKAKRFRSAFTTEQIKYLDAEFRKYPYIGSARRKEVSSALNIPERAVKIWFQNRRMKEKKDVTSNNTECDQHKHSRKIDAANDQLNNECTVTSTNNRHYASLPLMSVKNEPPKYINIAIKKENESFPTTDNKHGNEDHQPPAEFSSDVYKKYNIYLGNQEVSQPKPFVENVVTSKPPKMQSPKSEVSSTSLYEKLPHDLSRKRKPQQKPISVVQSSPGAYFPLNLKKYYTEPSLPVGSNMLWKPVQMLPLVPAASASAPARTAKECHCECRCHPASQPAPVLLQQGAQNPLTQYVLTALPFPNPYYKY